VASPPCARENASKGPNGLSAAPAIGVTLIAVDAVVDVSRHVLVLEIIRVVAAVAARALEHGVIVRVDVASRADVVGPTVVRRKLRVLRVIERGAGPCRCVVAGLARGREELRLRRMARVCRVVVVRLVAANARRRQGRVIVVDVAIAALARRHSMHAGEGKCGVGVVERGVGPDGRVVTHLAGRGETRRPMRRIVRGGVLLLMARVAQHAV